MILAEKIRTLRKRRELSQEHVADELGLSRPTYVQIEKGGREPTLSEIDKLAALFAVSREDFLSAHAPKASYEVVLERENKPKHDSKPDMRISVPQKRIGIFKEVLLYLLEKVGAKPNVGETVLYKLLYFIDFDFYEKYEEQLIGATYIKNHHGPTPVEFKKIVDQMIRDGEIEPVRSSYFQYPQRKYLPHREPNLNKFTGQALKHIDEVIARYSDMNAADLSDYSHDDVPWITAENGQALDYEAVFYRTPKTSVRNYDENDI